MPDLPYLDTHSGETVEELLALEGKYRTDSLISAFEQALGHKSARGEERTDEEWTIVAIEALECEVNNGGYNQFFKNSAGFFASTIVHALQSIDCPKTAKIEL